MDSFSSNTTTLPPQASTLNSNRGLSVFLASPLTLTLAVLLSFVAYVSYTPPVGRKVPEFTSDYIPGVGSWGFITRQWSFWKNSVARSKTGNFSFWLGKYHVVGLSGHANRKFFLDHKNLDFVDGSALVGHGPDVKQPPDEIFKKPFHKGLTWFQRRLYDMQKPEHLASRLSKVIEDARADSMNLANESSPITDPIHAAYRTAVRQASRIVFAEEISDDPKLLKTCIEWLLVLQSTGTLHTVAVPYLPSYNWAKRCYGRYRMERLVTPIIDARMKKGAPRGEDGLQILINSGDSRDYIIKWAVSCLFIATANAGVHAGLLLKHITDHVEWQDKIYQEVKSVAAAHSTRKDTPLIDQLADIPLEAWESSFPNLEICLRETVRIFVAFPMMRKNIGSEPIVVPETGEVIPVGSFASYNTTELHFSEELYPKPMTFDPSRWQTGREEYKKERYGFVGWGHGKHPCMGMRWAKIQQNIIISHALAQWSWTSCDKDGNPLPPMDETTHFDDHGPSLPQGHLCIRKPRVDTAEA